jgi:hypothetical protein
MPAMYIEYDPKGISGNAWDTSGFERGKNPWYRVGTSQSEMR